MPDGQRVPRPEELEREISAISGESHALADEVHQVRSDFEHARDEDHRKLTELESLGSRFETAREADSRKIHDLERRLAELESERNQARDKARALEDSLTETTTRLESTDMQVKNLQASSVEQAKQFTASLSDASNRLEGTENHVRELDDRLKSERKDYLNTIQGMLDRFRKQDLRMNWTMSVAGFALLLGTVAGVILIWEMQKNSRLLSGMSRDIKELMVSVNGGLSMQHTPQKENRQLALPATPPETVTAAITKPATGTTATAQPAPSTKATINMENLNTNYLVNALDRARSSSRLGTPQSRREDAKRFFENNATNEGMISLPSGVQYRIVTAGTGKSPSPSDQVVVAYVGIKPNGAVFDETYSTGIPSTFSMNEVIPGWREVLLKMQEGAEFELYVPPKLATSGGTRKRSMLGYEPNIYLIELIEVVKDGATDPAAPAK